VTCNLAKYADLDSDAAAHNSGTAARPRGHSSPPPPPPLTLSAAAASLLPPLLPVASPPLVVLAAVVFVIVVAGTGDDVLLPLLSKLPPPSPSAIVPYTCCCRSHSSTYRVMASLFVMPCFVRHATIFALSATDNVSSLEVCGGASPVTACLCNAYNSSRSRFCIMMLQWERERMEVSRAANKATQVIERHYKVSICNASRLEVDRT
jgi:hypothetical protein